MIDNNKIGEFLREYRKENNGITLRELSKRTGISFSHLSKIERGEHNPTKDTLFIIAEALDLNEDELYLMAGYAPKNSNQLGIGLDAFFPDVDPKEKKRKKVIDKIAKEFPDADLMFDGLANMTAEQLEEVYEFIKFKSQQNK